MKSKNVSLLVLVVVVCAVGVAGATSAPDLELTNVSANRSHALADEQIAVSCAVTNSGGLDSGSSRLKYYFSSDTVLDGEDRYLNYDNVGVLAAGEASNETANVRVPSGTPDGAYFILLVADCDEEVAELHEVNNLYALPIAVGNVVLVDGPDLVVTDASLDAQQADPDDVIAASCTIRNGGNEPATIGTRLKYYLSTDESYDAGDRYLNYDAVPSLLPSELGAESANLRVPVGTADGLYYVLFVADQTGVVHETDEQNNVHAEPLIVGDFTPLADLVLQSVQVPTPTVRAGETLAVSATAANIGVVNAPSARLVYYLSADIALDAADKQLSYDNVGALEVGLSSAEDANLRVSTATAAGSYYVLFVLDADGAVSESDEANNIVAVPVAVETDHPSATLADLVLSNATLGAPTVRAGEQITASVRVDNQGVAEAGSSRLKYYLSIDPVFDAGDSYLNYDAVGVLAVGEASPETANLRIPAATADGAYYILFIADAVDTVAERYESNNVVARSFTVGEGSAGGPVDHPEAELPDLMVVHSSVDSLQVMAGERASLHCEIENVGDYAALASKVKYYLSLDETFDADDDYVGYDNVPALGPGESSLESATPLIPAVASHGRWHLLVVADAALDVAETFESNNVVAIAFDVVVDNPSLDASDLYADTSALDKATVGAGYKLTVDAVVHNEGSQPAIAPRVKYYWSADEQHDGADDYLAYRQLEDLAVGAAVAVTADVRVPVTVPTGESFVLVVVDSERANAEQYESNNLLAIPITVGVDEGPNEAYPYACPDSVFTDPSLLGKNTVASFNALHLGWNNNKDMLAMACIVSHYDLVGLVEIYDPQGVADLELEVETLTSEGWSSFVSEHAVGNQYGMEYYAYLWRDAEVTMNEPLGFFDDTQDLVKREPYGANFTMGAFDFTFIVFHLQYGNTIATRRGEAGAMLDIYHYFQALNGPESDVLFGGDFNLPADDEAFTLLGVDGITFITDPEQPTSISSDGLASSFDNIFYNADVSELIGSGAFDYTNGNWSVVKETVSDHIPVWAAFDVSSDDD